MTTTTRTSRTAGKAATPAAPATPAKSADKADTDTPTNPDNLTETTTTESADKPEAFSLTGLAPAPVKVPTVTRGGGSGRSARDNSVVEGWLTELDKTRGEKDKYSKEARALTIPLAKLPEIRTRLIQAATKLNIGVSIPREAMEFVKDGKTVKVAKDADLSKVVADTVTIVYMTKVRSKRNVVKAVTGHDTTDASKEAVTGDKPAEGKSAEDKPAEDKPAEDKPAEKAAE